MLASCCHATRRVRSGARATATSFLNTTYSHRTHEFARMYTTQTRYTHVKAFNYDITSIITKILPSETLKFRPFYSAALRMSLLRDRTHMNGGASLAYIYQGENGASVYRKPIYGASAPHFQTPTPPIDELACRLLRMLHPGMCRKTT